MSTGSTYQRADGRWVAAVHLNGRKIVKYGRSKAEARHRLKELLNEQHAGTLILPSKLTVGDWVAQWFSIIEADRRPSTINGYREMLRPVIKNIGHVRIDRLTPTLLTKFFADLRRSGLASASTAKCYTVLGNSLRQAVRLGVLGVNPLDRVDRPRHRRTEQRYWTVDETHRFLQVVEASQRRYAPLFAFMVATGVRKSEALGLRWSDIDWVAVSADIARGIVIGSGKGIEQPPKTNASRRKVVLPPIALSALQRQPRLLDLDALIFVSSHGRTPSESTLREAMQGLCRTADVPHIPIHGLRHVHAALLVSQGIDPHTLRRRLGHSRVDMSLNVYAYALGSDHVAAAAFDRAIGDL